MSFCDMLYAFCIVVNTSVALAWSVRPATANLFDCAKNALTSACLTPADTASYAASAYSL